MGTATNAHQYRRRNPRRLGGFRGACFEPFEARRGGALTAKTSRFYPGTLGSMPGRPGFSNEGFWAAEAQPASRATNASDRWFQEHSVQTSTT